MITASKIQYLQHRISRYDDQYAYKDLFTSLYGYLVNFARTLIREKEAAEEIVSDVFIKVWEKRKELKKIDNLKVYLYVGTRNTALNYLERQKRSATDPLDDRSDHFTSIYLDPEQLLISAEMLALIQNAIDQLPSQCRIIFKLIKEDGLKYREVAEVLNISVKTVENQLAIAVKKIGKTIKFDIHTTLPPILRN